MTKRTLRLRKGVDPNSATVLTKSRRTHRIFSFFVWWVGPGIVLSLTLAYVGLAIDRQVYPPLVPVQGISMHPELRTGDMALLKKANFKELQIGDVIAFRTTSEVQQKWGVPGSYVHRIVTIQQGTNGKQFQTKGDNVPGMDPFWTIEQNVTGIFESKISNLGLPLVFFNSRQGKILIAGGVLILFLYWLLGVFERRRAAVEVNVYNLASIVDEARRLAIRMEEAAFAPPTNHPRNQILESKVDTHEKSIKHSMISTEIPKIKRSLRGYSRATVHKLLEKEKAVIQRDHELLEAKLAQAIRRQKTLAITFVTAQEKHLTSNWPLIDDKFTLENTDSLNKYPDLQ